MGPKFADYTDLVPPMQFPIGGKVYSTYGPTAVDGERLRAIVAREDTSFDGQPPEALWRLALGSVWDEMAADGVAYNAATRVALTVLTHFQYGSEAAEVMWESGADPAALQKYLEGDAATIAATATTDGDVEGTGPLPNPADDPAHVAQMVEASTRLVDAVTAAEAPAAATEPAA